VINSFLVTAADITAGTVDAFDCPVARAIRRRVQESNPKLDVFVLFGECCVWYVCQPRPGEYEEIRRSVKLPYHVQQWIEVFDLVKTNRAPLPLPIIAPLAFELNVPDDLFPPEPVADGQD